MLGTASPFLLLSESNPSFPLSHAMGVRRWVCGVCTLPDVPQLRACCRGSTALLFYGACILGSLMFLIKEDVFLR